MGEGARQSVGDGGSGERSASAGEVSRVTGDLPLGATREALREALRRTQHELGPRARRDTSRTDARASAPPVVPAGSPPSFPVIPQSSERRKSTLIVARFPHDSALAPVVAALVPRAVEVRRLDPKSIVRVARSWPERVVATLARTSVAATAAGTFGGLVGVLTLHGETLTPALVWIPGPLVGAALGAGAFGIAGLVLGALATLLIPTRRPNPR